MNEPTSTGEPQPCPLDEQAVAWALRVLEPEDEEQMRAHIPHCHSCQNTIRETEAIMGGLAASVEQVDPPPRLRAGILAQAAETPQTPTERGQATAPEPAPAAPAAPPPPPSRSGPPRRAQRRLGGRRLVAAAAVALALVGLGGLAAYTAQVQQQRDAQIAQSQALADLVVQLTQGGSPHATLSTGEGRSVAAVLIGPAERTVVTAGLPANDRSDTVYVMWGLGAGPPTPLAAFDVTAPGPRIHDLGPATGEPQFSSYAVSLEPGRTMPPVPTTVVASGAVET
jgi:hypothetical protein